MHVSPKPGLGDNREYRGLASGSVKVPTRGGLPMVKLSRAARGKSASVTSLVVAEIVTLVGRESGGDLVALR